VHLVDEWSKDPHILWSDPNIEGAALAFSRGAIFKASFSQSQASSAQDVLGLAR
jgi:hypothetical protein